MGATIIDLGVRSKSLAVGLAVRFAWLKKGGFAIIDQALFAGSNFVVNILLARSLPPTQYGAFALAFSVLLLIGAIHSAAITEPMMVFGPGKFSDGYRKYLGVLILGHFCLTIPFGALLYCAGAVVTKMASPSLGNALEGCGISVPLILFLWFARLAFYVKLKPAWSAVAGSIYFVAMMLMTGALMHLHRLTPKTGLIGIGCSGFAVALLFMLRLKPMWTRGHNPEVKRVAYEHWKYGRWSVATVLNNWIPSNIYYLVMPVWFGLAGTASLRALLNLMLPVQNCVAGLSMVLMPSLVHDHTQSGTAGMNRTMTSHFSVLAGIAITYSLALWISSHFVLRLLYGDKYEMLGRNLILFSGMIPLGAAAISIIGNGLRALERPDLIFWCYVAATVVSAAAGVPLTAIWGVTGALVGMCLASFAGSISMLVLYRNRASVPRG